MTTLSNLTTDQSALLAFKARVVDYRSVLTNNWSLSYPICSWVGISCGSRHQRVTALNLSDIGLGAEVFDAIYNVIDGNIPSGIGNFSSLFILNLGYNNLQGQIPTEIGNLQNLDTLVLSANNLSGPIPPTIFNISTLTVLNLISNQLSGHLPSTIGHSLPSIEYLTLAANNLTGKIPNSITNVSKLIGLELSFNSFSGHMPNTFGNLRHLGVLGLAFNNLTTESSSADQWSFLSSLTNCRNLTVLALAYNPLGGILPPVIGNFSASLRQFYASNSKLGGSIPKEIGKLRGLILLSLGFNDLNGTISPTMGRLKRLQGLSLEENNLEGSIPYDLCHLELMYGIMLNGNKLSGHIPPCLASLTSLRELHLGSNKLTSSIPSSLWSLEYILEINLFSNSLNDSLPSNVQKLKVLRVLDLSRNQLSGDIPSTIGALKDIETLSLASNQFQGPIPESVGSLISLESLDLSGNNLSGKIPKSLETLSHLKQFNVSRNRLEGEIPVKGSFKNLSAESFFGNYALCGPPKSRVPPCKQGSFGSVYKGTISDGTDVAIKVFNLQLERAFRSFDSECEVLRNVRHRNLIKILSSCSNPDFKALPTNILLDENMVAHVSDFGISKLLGEGEDSVTQTMTMATIGYMAPEYGSEGIVSAKCDVYSYGVLLMETFTRKRPTDEMFTGEMSLRRWVKESLPHGLTEVVDANLVREEQAFSAKMDCLLSIMDLALDCCMESPDKRMHMTDAAAKLKKIKVKFLDDAAASS
ncbi:protein kinase domain-containing protein [Citrus sinensis]|nr:protein kinase domain-containing protein [Citrus sinensis]